MVVAVPMSMTARGKGYSDIAAIASTIISDPTDLGLSISILRPVFIPDSTSIHSIPSIFFTAFFTVILSGGTTLESIAPSISFVFTPCISSIPLIYIEYSSSVLVVCVVILSRKYICLLSIPPTTIFELPISIANIIKLSFLYKIKAYIK